jgi:hypothetical protein
LGFQHACRRNPRNATAFEWFWRPAPFDDFDSVPPPVYRSAYMYGVPLPGLDFLPQHFSAERLANFG